MSRYDVLVVGGGPAGSTTAYRLAEAGASVLLVDNARFPRDKPCGGGLTMRAVRQLPFPVEPVVEDRITRARCRLRYGPVIERASEEVMCLLFFFSSRRRHTRYIGDWSSDVCSSDLDERPLVAAVIYNRLHAHMTLGIDATLRYGLDIPGTKSILQSQLQSDSPYNTRNQIGRASCRERV